MVFRRRNKRTRLAALKAALYPQGGWLRAAHYLRHRLTRLPDPPNRIARGVFAGIFVSFTPLFGLHFLAAALLAFVMRGNIFAALIASFVGNPLTFPVIAVISVQIGHWILDTGVNGVPASKILSAFAKAGVEVWANMVAMVTDAPTHWGDLSHFYFGLFKPYLVGGIAPGLAAGLAGYYISLSVIHAYQKLRHKRRRDRAETLRQGAAARLRAVPSGKDNKTGGS